MIPNSTEVRIEPSTICNYRCLICPNPTMKRKKEIMDFDLFYTILEKLHGYDTMTFSGVGEPLLDKGLEDKIMYARTKGFKTLLLTNGAFLYEERARTLKLAGLDSVRISMYGTTPESYAEAHGTLPERFEQTKRNIKAAKFNNLILTFNVIPGVNEEEVEEWVECWSPYADLEVWHPHNWVYGKKYREVQSEKLKTCGRPFNGPLQVQVDGTVIMCCFDYEGELLLGDLKTQTLAEIFNGEKYTWIVRNHQLDDHCNVDRLTLTICHDCDQRNAYKSDVMVYSSTHDLVDRVTKTSTTYRRVT